jgi:hypothetical protein
VSKLKKEKSYTLLPLWAFVACFRVKFTFTFMNREFFPEGKAAGL